MSRTFRRVNTHTEKEYVDDWFPEFPCINHLEFGESIDVCRAKFRSDSFGITNPPKCFRQSLNRQYRSKCKMLLRNTKSINLDNLVFPLHKKNANWLYW